jgi:hypothetical protein
MGCLSGSNACFLKLRSAGYDPVLILKAMLGIQKRDRIHLHKPAPLVKDGEIVADAFSPADTNWMKELRINLGNEE